MNYLKILLDALFGGLILGITSFLNQYYSETNDVVRVFAYLWATPILYFFFLNLFSNRQAKTIREFNKHAFLGVIITLIAMFFTHIYYESSRKMIIFLNLFYLIFISILYFSFGIYKVGVL